MGLESMKIRGKTATYFHETYAEIQSELQYFYHDTLNSSF